MKYRGRPHLEEMNQYTNEDFDMDELFIRQFTGPAQTGLGRFYNDLIHKYHVSDWIRQINLFEEILECIEQIEHAGTQYL